METVGGYMRERWIPVDEQLPPENKPVVVWDSDNSIAVVAYRWLSNGQSNYTMTAGDGYGFCEYAVTHWMPLSEPPRENVPAAFAVYDCDGAFVSALETLQECEERYGRDTRNRYIPLYREAADEIARLRLTDAEREAIKDAASHLLHYCHAMDRFPGETYDTLLRLLERTT